MDGTLLRRDKTISEKTAAVLARLHERGILFVPATGRFYNGLPEFIRSVPGLRYCILMNGALLLDLETNTALRRADIPTERALEILRFMETLPMTRDVYIRDCESWMEREFREDLEHWVVDPQIRALIEATRKPVDGLAEYIRRTALPVHKLQGFFQNEETHLAGLSAIRSRFPDMNITCTVPLNVEINSPAADKGQALIALMEHLGIAPEEVIAFGDESNDITMLRAAGTGVAMGNASDAVKAAADSICGTNEEDGVAEVLLHRVL